MIAPLLPTSDSDSAGAGAWRVLGKWFQDTLGDKVFLNGVTYGPFKPNAAGEPWPEPDQLQRDFSHIATLGFDTLRLYELPSEEVLQAARKEGLRLLVGIPWTQHVDFLADPAVQADAIDRVRRAARQLGQDPTIAGLLVGNEIEKGLVRWMRPEAVRVFLETLITVVKTEAPGKPVAYASYPSTEYLSPRNADFVAFNVFLEEADKFEAYLQRLQVMADGKPLVITEFGLDTKTHDEITQAEALRWQREIMVRAGAAGNFWFSYTDEWHRGGEDVTGWDFGLVTRERRPKLACAIAARLTRKKLEKDAAIHPGPKISVIVCSRNGSGTLRNCLVALGRQSYANHEVLLIDDGSTDTTPEIARDFPYVRYHRQDQGGLSAARNHGMQVATGEILAYTDDDCIPDEDWLKHLAPAFDDPRWVAAGGPNLPPPPRNLTETCVAAAPGAPAHVLIGNEEAEHLPGCNLAIRKTALQAIGGFQKEFTTAGDDVDVCWRLQEQGGKLRFVPAAVVWHHRRFTVRAYLRQQSGYGHAEAMLIRRYPRRFAWLGGARWRGAIYGDETYHGDLTQQAIHFGPQGLAPFQCIYTGSGDTLAHWLSGLPWLAAALMAAVLGFMNPGWLMAAVVMFLLAANVARDRAAINDFMLVGRTWRHRALLWLLCFIQPVVRDWARLRGMFQLGALPKGKLQWPWQDTNDRDPRMKPETEPLAFWSENQVGREAWLEAFETLLGEQARGRWVSDGEWSLWDGSVTGTGVRVWLVSSTEYHGQGRCVVRVKTSAMEPPTAWLLIAAAVCLALGASWIALSAVAFFMLLHAAVAWINHRAQQRVQGWVAEAAARAGLTPMIKGDPRHATRREVPLPATALDSR